MEKKVKKTNATQFLVEFAPAENVFKQRAALLNKEEELQTVNERKGCTVNADGWHS